MGSLPFNQESWIWYTCATCLIAARLISRKIHLGAIRRLQYDDCIMGLFVTAAYTALIVCSNKYVKAQSNLLPPGFDVGSLTAHDLDRRRYGSKIVVVVEQAQIAVIWACKTTLLTMYHRLTRTARHSENLAIKLLSAYVALGFVVMEILYFAVWCRPITEYWAVPEPSSSQCNALINHRITKAVFNLSSDIIMLAIALPMLIRSMLPMKRKLILCGIFSLGIFVIIASMLNSYYSFKNPYRQTWIFWYVRESSTAILVANLPYTWTILREFFDLDSFNYNRPPPWTFHSARTAQGRRTTQLHSSAANTATAGRGSRSPAVSKGSQGTQTMTLVDFIKPLKHRGHDFASMPSLSAHAAMASIDGEQGLMHDARVRPASPAHSQHAQPRILEYGTGGFAVHHRPMQLPPRAVLAAQCSRLDEASLSSTRHPARSPTPSSTSLDSSGIRQERRGFWSGTAGTAGHGRTRAKLSI
ncbi:hypothetical protein ACEQ8H_000662 [Pleosporales sp. CAS-2024a]